jgi:hypothetical protein
VKRLLVVLSLIIVIESVGCGGKASLATDSTTRNDQIAKLACNYAKGKVPEPHGDVHCRAENDGATGTGWVVTTFPGDNGDVEKEASISVQWDSGGGKWIITSPGLSDFSLTAAEQDKENEEALKEQERKDNEAKKATLEADIAKLQGIVDAFDSLKITPTGSGFILGKDSRYSKDKSESWMHFYGDSKMLVVYVDIQNPTGQPHTVDLRVTTDKQPNGDCYPTLGVYPQEETTVDEVVVPAGNSKSWVEFTEWFFDENDCFGAAVTQFMIQTIDGMGGREGPESQITQEKAELAQVEADLEASQ